MNWIDEEMIIKPKWYDYFMLPYLWTKIMLLQRTNNYLWNSNKMMELEIRVNKLEKEKSCH